MVAGLEQEEVWTSPLPSWCSAPILRGLLRDLRVSWAIFQPHGRMLCFLATTGFFFLTCPLSHFCTVSLRFAPLILFF